MNYKKIRSEDGMYIYKNYYLRLWYKWAKQS